MLPYSPLFVFLVLPAAFLLTRLLPVKWKNTVLTLLSCLCIAWGSPRDAVLVLLGVCFNYFTARAIRALIAAGNEKPARALLAAGVAGNLAFLLFFKYSGFALGVFGKALPAGFPAAPLGVSFYTFAAISFLVDTCRGSDVPQGFFDTALYLTFFPKFLSGPIVPYADFAAQLKPHAARAGEIERGFARFIVGLAKKLLLADTLSALFATVTARQTETLTAADALLGALLYAFTLYYDFSGYSDMSIGLGELTGFSFAENFDHPYLSGSFTEFWRRWHISLGRWFRDYVYIPLGGSRKGTAATVRNLCVVWLLTGLWHGANRTFLVWGAYHALLLLAEKYPLKRLKAKLPRWANIALTFVLAVLGWVPFFSPSLSYAGSYLARMLGIGGAGFANAGSLLLLSQSALPLALAFLGGTTLPQSVGKKLTRTNRGRIILAVGAAAALVLCTAAMLGGTAKSFLYAAF